MIKLVDKIFWDNYWSTKKFQKKVVERHFFSNIFKQEIKKNYKTIIEIGGFPGEYSIYFKKFYNLKPTFVDYVIDKKIIHTLLKKNNLPKNSIEVIKADFFKYKFKKTYDVVTSFGFIEHFTNLKDVILRHIKLAKKDGTIIIGIPNFISLNGLVQLLLDPNNLNAHNLEAMQKKNLENILSEIPIKKFKVFYYGGLLIWLENIQDRSFFVRFIVNIINYFGYLLKIIGFNCRFTSPYIFIVAYK